MIVRVPLLDALFGTPQTWNPRLGTPDLEPQTHFLGHAIPYACRLSAGYAPESDVYSSQGHQTGVGQPGEGPRSAYRNFLTFHDDDDQEGEWGQWGPQPLSCTESPCGPLAALVSNEGLA